MFKINVHVFLFSAGRRPIGPGLRKSRLRVMHIGHEPNGNTLSPSISTEVSN